MPYPSLMLRLLVLVCVLVALTVDGGYIGEYPAGCDESAAAQCEYDFLLCRLFGGPVDDPPTMCGCGEDFYGSCLRNAGCEIATEVGALSLSEIYMKKCVDHIRAYDCDDVMMCAVNCASDANVDRNTSKIMPFNNYGSYYLRIRVCAATYNEQRLERYSLMEVGRCASLEEFTTCSRMIPPQTFTPVALPIDATYVEVDLCELDSTQPYGFYCHTEWEPQRLFGNEKLFPRTFDIAPTNTSACSSDADCLGSFCDTHFRPPLCSPKTMKHVDGTGGDYFSDPFA